MSLPHVIRRAAGTRLLRGAAPRAPVSATVAVAARRARSAFVALPPSRALAYTTFERSDKDPGLHTAGVVATGEGPKLTIMTSNHEIVLDEPRGLGGEGAGPDPMEALLAGLAGSIEVTANYVARKMDPMFDLGKVKYSVKGHFDAAAFRKAPAAEKPRTTFQIVDIVVTVATDESDERVQDLKREVEARCPGVGLFSAAGVEINSEWKRAEQYYS